MTKIEINIDDLKGVWPDALLIRILPRKKKKALKKELSKRVSDALTWAMNNDDFLIDLKNKNV